MKKNLYIMFAVTFLHGMVFYGPIATLYRYEYGITIFDITSIEGISLALCLCLEIPLGILADKIGYKKMMVLTCTVFLVSKIIFWQADSFVLFLLERVLIAIVFSGLSGLDTSIVYLSDKKENSRRNFGIYNTLGSLGLLSAAIIYTWIIGNNYRFSALLTVVSHALALILTLFLKESLPEKRKKSDWQSIKNITITIVNNSRLILYLVAITLFNQTHQLITVFISQLKYEDVGIPLSGIGAAFILLSLVGSLGFLSEPIGKKFGNIVATILFYLVAIIGCSLLTITTSGIACVLFVVSLRLAHCLFEPIQLQRQNEFVKSTNRATELSIYSAIMSVLGVVVNLVFGKMAQYSISLSFAFGALLCVTGLILYASLTRSARKAI